MTNEPDLNDAEVGSQNASTNPSRSFAPRPVLGRGFGAYAQSHPAHTASNPGVSGLDANGNPISVPRPGAMPGAMPGSTVPVSRKNHPSIPVAPQPTPQPQRRWFGWLTHAKKNADSTAAVAPNDIPRDMPQGYAGQPSGSPSSAPPYPFPPGFEPTADPSEWPQGTAPEEQILTPTQPRVWERQPYAFLLYFLMVGGAFTGAWFFGILVAQVLPGRFSQPPLQERFLRKSSRLTHRLWHFSQLWQTPTEQVRIEAIPLPETGPVSAPAELSPLERQPLVDELNAVETEILTLDRRLQSLEKQIGKPPYQGAGLENRISTMRAAIDPPVRQSAKPTDYEPVASDPIDQLLDVAQLQITLPSDVLFAPGGSELKEDAVLERVLNQLVAYPEATISVRSYSDDQVGAIASREYTLAQANTLARYLQTSLPTNHRWIMVGVGSTQPISDNADAAKRQQNRRIEILVDTR